MYNKIKYIRNTRDQQLAKYTPKHENIYKARRDASIASREGFSVGISDQQLITCLVDI